MGFEPKRSLKNFKAKALLEFNPIQDVSGNAQAGVEGADRMSATVTPNPSLSVVKNTSCFLLRE